MKQLALGALTLATLLFATPSHAQTSAPSKEVSKVCGKTDMEQCLVRHFKNTMEASLIRGKLVYSNYCALCHGVEGKGDGRAAKLHKPPPFNLTLSGAPREYTEQVIRRGGEAMGRGKGMPPWGEQLTEEQTADVLNYVFSIRLHKTP